MKPTIRFQLSFMMFLEFFIWGGWFVTLGTFLNNNLHASGLQSASVFSTQSWGAIIAPFIIGLIADRFFNAEKILGILHIAGAVMMYQMYQSADISSFYPYVLGYMVLYMPTLALVNSVAFNQMGNPEKEFSVIRVWGTIGWIVAGLAISYLFHWDAKGNAESGFLKNTFLMSAITSLVLGVFSFTLPKTPPKKSTGEKVSVTEMLGLNALKLLKDKNFLIFFISSILICIPLAFYYQNANSFLSNIGVTNPTGKMTIGQISEVLFLLLLPVFFSKYGFKKTILVGMLACGVCYDFFFVSGQIYTNAKAGEKYKSAAQGLITLATYGVGMLIGFWVAGLITDQYKLGENAFNYKMIWLIPSGIALVVFLIFALLFKDEKKQAEIPQPTL